MQQSDYLFVYGSLMQGFDHPLAKELEASQKFIGEAHLRGKLYRLSWYPGAVYIPDSEKKVYGHLYHIQTNKEKLLSVLDKYEGIDPSRPESGEFIRQTIPVEQNEKVWQAFVYVLNRPIAGFQEIPSGRFMNMDG